MAKQTQKEFWKLATDKCQLKSTIKSPHKHDRSSNPRRGHWSQKQNNRPALSSEERTQAAGKDQREPHTNSVRFIMWIAAEDWMKQRVIPTLPRYDRLRFDRDSPQLFLPGDFLGGSGFSLFLCVTVRHIVICVCIWEVTFQISLCSFNHFKKN